MYVVTHNVIFFLEDEIDDSLSSDEDENDVEGVASNPAAVPYPKDSEWTAVDTYRPLPVNTTPRQILVDILRLLSDSSLLNKGHTVYLDRFYSSPELFQQLAEKGTGAVGTVNKSRKGLPKDLVSAKLKKGEMSFRRKDNVLAMKWKDKRDVYTLSTRHQATFGTHTKRNGSVVLKPLQVLDYNLNKIGVDIGDQRLQYNPFQHRTVKWWRKLYFHLLLMGVSNAFWLYNAVHRKKITITDFITVLAVQLVEDDTLEFIPRNEGTVGRLTKRHFLQHIPATTKKYAARVCHVCSSRSKKQSGKASRKETRYECEQCGVALCLEPCFKIFHTKKQYDSV
ncbi:piggyBac transposable element-derived protein 4-like [Schistocerca serialis cubense]|uniref:piggyBac transposable element-derived protein 4-like n=1 Tax=Schistocerca serialis cubense TaxID=2023355 RepID=UPI00214E8A2B|nr:piggyBac transposable element-derived protein 4-like [Schistocerca serialis cubense]